MIRNDA